MDFTLCLKRHSNCHSISSFMCLYPRLTCPQYFNLFPSKAPCHLVSYLPLPMKSNVGSPLLQHKVHEQGDCPRVRNFPFLFHESPQSSRCKPRGRLQQWWIVWEILAIIYAASFLPLILLDLSLRSDSNLTVDDHQGPAHKNIVSLIGASSWWEVSGAWSPVSHGPTPMLYQVQEAQ